MGMMSKISLEIAIVSLVVSLGLLQTPEAQDSPQDYVNAHNKARASVGVGPMKWENKVADAARNHVNRLKGSCKIPNLGPNKGPYGLNIAWVDDGGDLSAAGAVQIWMDGRANYDYKSNSCIRDRNKCLTYSQVVWRNSVRLGCAKVRCNNGRRTIIVCNYDPQGNNGQRPY